MRVAALALTGALLLTGCPYQPRGSDTVTFPAPYVSQGVSVSIIATLDDRAGRVGAIVGVAKNTSGRDLTVCMINLDLLDASGVKVATAMASTQGLRQGQEWRFQATVLSAYPVRFTAVAPGTVTVIPVR